MLSLGILSICLKCLRVRTWQLIDSIYTYLVFLFQPRVDDKHLKWLHLRIRPSSFPFTDTAMYAGYGKVKSKALVDGRWTLAFQDEESCKNAMSMVVEEMALQSCMVEKSLEPLLDLDRSTDDSRVPGRVEDDNTA